MCLEQNTIYNSSNVDPLLLNRLLMEHPLYMLLVTTTFLGHHFCLLRWVRHAVNIQSNMYLPWVHVIASVKSKFSCILSSLHAGNYGFPHAAPTFLHPQVSLIKFIHMPLLSHSQHACTYSECTYSECTTLFGHAWCSSWQLKTN